MTGAHAGHRRRLPARLHPRPYRDRCTAPQGNHLARAQTRTTGHNRPPVMAGKYREKAARLVSGTSRSPDDTQLHPDRSFAARPHLMTKRSGLFTHRCSPRLTKISIARTNRKGARNDSQAPSALSFQISVWRLARSGTPGGIGCEELRDIKEVVYAVVVQISSRKHVGVGT